MTHKLYVSKVARGHLLNSASAQVNRWWQLPWKRKLAHSTMKMMKMAIESRLPHNLSQIVESLRLIIKKLWIMQEACVPQLSYRLRLHYSCYMVKAGSTRWSWRLMTKISQWLSQRLKKLLWGLREKTCRISLASDSLVPNMSLNSTKIAKILHKALSKRKGLLSLDFDTTII